MTQRRALRGAGAALVVLLGGSASLSPVAAGEPPAPGPVAPATSAPPPVARLADGLLVDAAGARAFVRLADGNLACVALDTGALRWRWTRASRPLALQGDRLLVQTDRAPGNALELAVVAAADGAVVLPSLVATLPAGCVACLDALPGCRFSITARGDAAGFVLGWSFARTSLHALEGLPPDAPNSAWGVLRLSLPDGILSPGEAGMLVEAVPPAPPAGVLQGYVADPAVSSPRVVDDVWARVRVDLVERRRRGRLERWSAATGEALASVVLWEDDAQVAPISLDGRHVVACLAPPAGRLAWTWRVFRLATGERVGTCEQPTAASLTLVVGERLLFVARPYARREGQRIVSEPLRIESRRLPGGEVAWSLPVRDENLVRLPPR